MLEQLLGTTLFVFALLAVAHHKTRGRHISSCDSTRNFVYIALVSLVTNMYFPPVYSKDLEHPDEIVRFLGFLLMDNFQFASALLTSFLLGDIDIDYTRLAIKEGPFLLPESSSFKLSARTKWFGFKVLTLRNPDTDWLWARQDFRFR